MNISHVEAFSSEDFTNELGRAIDLLQAQGGRVIDVKYSATVRDALNARHYSALVLWETDSEKSLTEFLDDYMADQFLPRFTDAVRKRGKAT